jgi:hypothetical protein
MSCALGRRRTGNYVDSFCCVPPVSVALLPGESLEPVFRLLAPGTHLDVGAKAKRAQPVPGWSSLAFAAHDEFRTRGPFAAAHTS